MFKMIFLNIDRERSLEEACYDMNSENASYLKRQVDGHIDSFFCV